MKKYLTLIPVLAVLLIGCGSPKKTAYTTLATVGMTVDKANDVLVLARVEGKVSDADWTKAKDVQRRWLFAYNVACDFAAFDYTKAAPKDLLQLESEILNTINQILQGTP